ncbi:Stamen-specific protein FIL1 [Glycine max]|nr:Stamen-specific protein FIL1 [Glycine max]
MAAATKSLLSLILLLVVSHETQMAMTQSSTCSSQLSDLNVCAPFVVPGVNTNPNATCCNALQAVDRDCLCNTIRIASQLASQCQIPSLSCGNWNLNICSSTRLNQAVRDIINNTFLAADLHAIYNGLKLAWQTGFKDIICVTDSKCAIELIASSTHHHAPLVNAIRDLLAKD